MKTYLREGSLAGAAGGVAMAVFLLLVGERSLAEAIAREAAGGGHEEVFTRGAQVVGGAIGTTLYGVALGIVLGFTVGLVRHRLRGSDWDRSVWVAAAGFLSVVAVPFVKYPPSPPGVGDPATVGRRTALYLLLIAVSLVSTWTMWRLRHTLAARGLRREVAVPLALLTYLAMVGLALITLPPGADAGALPVDLVWRFRLQSLGGSALLFSVAGLVLGARLVRRGAPEPRASTVAHA